MSRPQGIAYAFFAQTVLLLMLYAAAALLAALKFVTPVDPLAGSLPYQHIGALSGLLLNLAALTGLIGGGVYLLADRSPDERRLRLAFGLWTTLLLAAVAAGLLGLLEGRAGLELPPLLDAAQALALLLLLASLAHVRAWPPTARVWLVGLLLTLLGILLGLLPPGDYMQDRALRALAAGLSINIAYPLMAVALGFWLMRRFSSVPALWADIGLYTAAGLVTVAGLFVSLPPFYALDAPDWTRTLGNIGLIVVPVCYLIVAAHGYRALSDRNGTQTLAAHWFALALLLWLIGPGLLGALQAAPGINQWTAGTRLADLQTTLTVLASLCLALGIVNQAAADLRGQTGRVTGLTPFWLIAFGSLGGASALGGAGLVQVYLERRLSLGYLETQTLIAPLYAGWALALLAFALGTAIYALAFWLRRPGETVA